MSASKAIPKPSNLRVFFSAPVSTFLEASEDEIYGSLSKNSSFSDEPKQKIAWAAEIRCLKESLQGLSGRLCLEFIVPRIGTRIDAVLLTEKAVVLLEFKVGSEVHTKDDLVQAWDYALDLKNFHSASHSAAILPILIATEATSHDSGFDRNHVDGVFRPVRATPGTLRALIDDGLEKAVGENVNTEAWVDAPYHPTPTIIEAARRLYAGHSVASISRNDAGSENITLTSGFVQDVVERSRAESRKSIVFVTGVPGAGKTLVGLNIATTRRDEGDPTHAVFLSGNGPLVAVLREALTRDEVARVTAEGGKARKNEVGQKVKAFIQNIHHFRDAGLQDEDRPPSDHVVIFDEAQRAWDHAMTADFMKRKKGKPGFTKSEPEFLLSYMDRHADWAVVVCLVGGGQEINRGEAGISAWLDAVKAGFAGWEVYISSELSDSEYGAGRALDSIDGRPGVHTRRELHLSTSMRSFRSEHVSKFVKAVLDRERLTASTLLKEAMQKYSIAVTRDLNKAKNWLRERAQGSERYGVVASSNAHRLKPHAIDIRIDVDPIHWFLDGDRDTRSSCFLEDAATEFQVQGLELDWVCVAWCADFRFDGEQWSHHAFWGDSWRNVLKQERQQYLMNAYRVLLTRARQGMVIFVPEGDDRDHTRPRKYYNHTYKYLVDLGITELS